jgi:hypothetical protein
MLEKEWQRENVLAWRQIQGMSWKRVASQELFQDVADARLVLYGEVHLRDGPLRDSQKQLLKSFSSTPEFEAVGFEPSVESAQQGVLEFAQSLGMTVIPLEENWEELVTDGRLGARDEAAASAIENFIKGDRRHRMFVLRGESHVMPDGYLVRRLSVRPLIILSGNAVTVPLCIGGLRCIGETFRLGSSSDVYVVPADEDASASGVVALWKRLEVH